jgi:hypothetical protein
MRPSVEEQLLGTCRILEKVICPCVVDQYALTILQGLIANLRMLSSAVPGVAGFLRSDNLATAVLLGQLQAGCCGALAESIALALVKPEPDATDTQALDQRNGELRELLSQALGEPKLTPSMRAAALTHMSARASAAPMRYVSTSSPSPKKAS